MSTVTWVLDSGSYLVSSKEHLLMVMQLGSFTGDDLITYSPTGDVPPSYLTSNFRQSSDIDLEIDSNCFPIGRLSGTAFTGEYDGGSFSISNYTSIPSSSAVHGLFGWIGGATLKDIKLAGNWNVTGSSNTADNSAALVARITGTGNIIERIDINGTVTCTGTTDSFGCIVAKIQGDVDITDITVRGIVNATAQDFCSGIISHIDSGTVTAKNLRYAPTGNIEYTRPSGSGENGTNAIGAIVGTIDAAAVVTIENAVNAMTGNIIGLNCAGVIGMSLITNVSNAIFTNLVNAMTGNIVATGAGGGIFARTEIGTSSYLLNVMKGDITTGSRAGGISGLIFTGTAVNCIVAMNGNIVGDPETEVGAVELSTGTVTIEWATSDFGFTTSGSPIVDINTKPVAASPWAYHADFPEIPYLEMSAIDSELNTSYVGTPFPNISGNSTIYDLENDYYTVCFDSTFFPVETTLGVPISDYSLFKYDTVGFNAVESQGAGIGFVAAPYSAIFVQVFAYIAIVTFFSLGTSFDVSSTQTGFSEIFQIQGSSSSTSLQITLDENTEYNIQVYGDGVIAGSKVITTPAADNTTVGEMITYLNNDLSELEQPSLQGVLEFIGGSLDTGDQITVNLYTDTSSINERTLTFVDDLDTVSIANNPSVLTPFVQGGASTSVTLEFTDGSTTEDVTFNDGANTVTIAGTDYSAGDTLIVDGKKCKIASLE